MIAAAELKRICSKLSIPDYVKKEALKYYRKSFENNLIKGRSIKGMVAACIYLACRIKCIPIGFNDILYETSISTNTVKKCYKIVIKNSNVKIPNTDLISFVPKYISDLGLNFDMEKITIKILKFYLKKSSINGINPKGVCAGALYLASKLKNLKLKQKEIAEVVGITEVTLRSRYKEILNVIDLLNQIQMGG